MYVRLRAGGDWSARVEQVNGQAVTLYECVDSETGETTWLPADRFTEGQASTDPESVLDKAEAKVRQVFGQEVQQNVLDVAIEEEEGPPDSWWSWDPAHVPIPWWCGSWAAVGAFAACYMAGAPMAMMSFSSGPLFGPVPSSAIVSGILTTVGWVGAFAAFFRFQRRSLPWVPVRVEQVEVAAGSPEEIQQVLSDTVQDLREGKIKTSAANSIMRAAALQSQLSEQGGLAGAWSAGRQGEAGPAVKKWVNGRGFVKVQKGSRQAWHPAEEYGWQGGEQYAEGSHRGRGRGLSAA